MYCTVIESKHLEKVMKLTEIKIEHCLNGLPYLIKSYCGIHEAVYFEKGYDYNNFYDHFLTEFDIEPISKVGVEKVWLMEEE